MAGLNLHLFSINTLPFYSHVYVLLFYQQALIVLQQALIVLQASTLVSGANAPQPRDLILVPNGPLLTKKMVPVPLTRALLLFKTKEGVQCESSALISNHPS